MADYISVRLPAELAPEIETHQRRTQDLSGVTPSFTAAAAALVRLGAEAARREDERVERLERAQTA